MPTYEYRCAQGHHFERIQKMSDKPVSKCPVCGARATRMISGGQGLIFKGSGFYITDYGKDGKGPRKESETQGASESKGTSKGEAKSDPTSGSKGDVKSETQSASKSDAKGDAKPATAPKRGKTDAS